MTRSVNQEMKLTESETGESKPGMNQRAWIHSATSKELQSHHLWLLLQGAETQAEACVCPWIKVLARDSIPHLCAECFQICSNPELFLKTWVETDSIPPGIFTWLPCWHVIIFIYKWELASSITLPLTAPPMYPTSFKSRILLCWIDLFQRLLMPDKLIT